MDEPIYFFDTTPLYSIGENATISQIAIAPHRYFQGADLAWMMISSALVLLMVPGIALFYSGVSNSQFALSQAWLPIMTTAVVGLEWYLWGYSIVFSNGPSSHTFWGGTDGIALHNVLLRPVPSSKDLQTEGPVIPELVYALFQGMFASFTASLVSGAAIWKDRPGQFLVFIILWTTFVYNPIARWTWNPEGWSNKRGVLDFAGGTAVHICAGATVFAHSMYHLDQPGKGDSHNVENVLLGTLLLWIGWLGFNGGSALGANLRAVSACISTHLSACAGGVTLCLLRSISGYIWPSSDGEHARNAHVFRWSILEFCNGAVVGLVCITPAAGYVPHQISPLFGVIGALFCSQLTPISEDLDDTHGIIVFHGFGGLVGMVLTGFFARKDVARLDGFTNIMGGGWDGHWAQLGWQVADALAGMAWAFTITIIILLALEPVMYFARSKRARYSTVTGDKLTDEWTMREAIEMLDNPTRQAISR
ncbi:hypothetical protein W97_00331 [Coniosporium apollinis CBS 100218]|uniref:Ammonium transporter AmtB-like domain-containing protein n=1 Tax=Coniosporium apollinis (strain CBS 100218) TaxID=1168221 RepID=R7YGV0_CONA1|nr:uncharacterized protein W97_00331 [Coniosporium apollinis CBS 100218]EON61120.1 hypothetical protein W97_00331 [Coniosporium apollinis CBS 100218]